MTAWLNHSRHVLGIAVSVYTAMVVVTWARGAVPLPTPLEETRFTRLSSSAEISGYLHQLARKYPQAQVETIGSSVEGRPLEALVLTGSTAETPNSDRLTVEIVGSQHGMEGAGAESLLFVARELLDGTLRHVLDEVNVVLVPNSNPDGLEIGKRVNANGVNLNTDFVTLTQPESRALVAALDRFRPEVVLDVHESAVLKKNSLAREGYLTDFTVQFEIANNPNIVPSLRSFAMNEVLTPWIAGVDAAGLNAHRYFGEIQSSRQQVTNGGLSLQNLRNRSGIEGTLSFLMETRLDPKYGVYPTFRNIGERVTRQRISIERFLNVVHERRSEILAEVAQARRQANTLPLALAVRYVADPADPPVSIDLRRIDDGALERIEFLDSRTVAASMPLRMPKAYLIRGHQAELSNLIDRQGIRCRKINAPQTIRVVEFTAGSDANAATVRERLVKLETQPGDLWIDLDQSRGRLAALLLEPRSDSSLFRTPQYSQLVAAGQTLPIYRVPR